MGRRRSAVGIRRLELSVRHLALGYRFSLVSLVSLNGLPRACSFFFLGVLFQGFRIKIPTVSPRSTWFPPLPRVPRILSPEPPLVIDSKRER